MHVSFKLSVSFTFSFVIVLILNNIIQRNPLFVLCIMAINGFALVLMQSKLKHFFHVVRSLEFFSESLTATTEKFPSKYWYIFLFCRRTEPTSFSFSPSQWKTQRKEPEIHDWARVVKVKTMYTSCALLEQSFKCGVFCNFIFIHPGWIQRNLQP